MLCPSCGHNAGDARFCPGCGTPLARRCPECAAPLAPAARFCGECGARAEGTARPAEPDQEAGERRQLTVLFCDLVGSTELAARLDPEDYRAVVHAYHEAAARIVTSFGGHVAQLLGDGVLAYFGWPQAFDDAAERGVRAALGLVAATAELEAEGQPLAARVGLHTGAVVVSGLGGEGRRETLALGGVPNVASRVQAAAAPGTVLISAATHRLVTGIFVVEDLGLATLKGVAEPVQLYRVVQPSGVRSRLDVAVGSLTPMVGRELELATLVDRWERAADGEGQGVLVLGEAGVGKSRLAYALRERLSGVPHTWLECRSTPYTQATPFFPVIELVQQGLSFAPEESAESKIEKLERGLGLVGLGSPESVALLADLLDLPAPHPLEMSPELQRRKTIELLAAWNLALAGVQPLVLLAEDLHWSDPSSLELFGRVVAQSATARVLLVATARPEFAAPWPARSNLNTLQLARLTRRQAREMVTALGGGALPSETIEALVARADGVPLYAEELTKAVIEPGTARGAESIPATLADSLMARLDRLSAAKEVAQRAAVLGREFGYELLAAVAGLEEAALRRGLERLVEAEIVFQRGEPPEALYTFKHALVQEAAYESLLRRTRQHLHGRAVEILTTRFPERATTEPEVVARHAEAAGHRDDALRFYTHAGERAKTRSAHEEAIRHFRKAIELLDGAPAGPERDAREAALQIELVVSLMAVRGYSHAEIEAPCERAVALAEQIGDLALLSFARINLATYCMTRGEMIRAHGLYLDGLQAAEAREDMDQIMIWHALVSVPEHYQGSLPSSLVHCERALELYEPKRHGFASWLAADMGVVALRHAAWNLWYLGHPDRALARVREAIALARSLEHTLGLAESLIHEAIVHGLRRDFAAQRAEAAEARALCEAQGFPLWLALAQFYDGRGRVASGDPTGLAEMEAGLGAAAATGNRTGAPGLLWNVAEAQQSLGRLADARATVAAALAIAADTGQHFFDAELTRLDGALLLATGGSADEAAARYERAIAIAREQEARSFELRAATSWARLLRERGDRAAARALLAPVYAWFTEGFDTGDLVDAKALLDELG